MTKGGFGKFLLKVGDNCKIGKCLFTILLKGGNLGLRVTTKGALILLRNFFDPSRLRRTLLGAVQAFPILSVTVLGGYPLLVKLLLRVSRFLVADSSVEQMVRMRRA